MDLSASKIIVGTSHLGSIWHTPKSEFYFFDSIFDANFATFDLAASYQIGGTEKLFGAWIQTRQNREKLFLISKGGHPYPVIAPNRLTPKALQADLEASLRRLKTDYLDLYLLHRDHPNANLEAIAEFVQNAMQAGKIKAFGVSNWHHERIEQLMYLVPVEASSPHFSLEAWAKPPFRGGVSIAGPENQAARDFYTHTQIPVLAWSPLRGLAPEKIKTGLAYLRNQSFRAYPILGSCNLQHLIEARGSTIDPRG